jgi:hypothetical protein
MILVPRTQWFNQHHPLYFFQLSLWMGGILLVLCKLVNVHYFSKEMYTYTSGLNHLTFKREVVIPKNHHVYQKQDQNVI